MKEGRKIKYMRRRQQEKKEENDRQFEGRKRETRKNKYEGQCKEKIIVGSLKEMRYIQIL